MAVGDASLSARPAGGGPTTPSTVQFRFEELNFVPSITAGPIIDRRRRRFIASTATRANIPARPDRPDRQALQQSFLARRWGQKGPVRVTTLEFAEDSPDLLVASVAVKINLQDDCPVEAVGQFRDGSEEEEVHCTDGSDRKCTYTCKPPCTAYNRSLDSLNRSPGSTSTILIYRMTLQDLQQSFLARRWGQMGPAYICISKSNGDRYNIEIIDYDEKNTVTLTIPSVPTGSLTKKLYFKACKVILESA
ncbi:hypothetical protein QJS10_CPB15g01648 [Acorus calamus]|uniref:Uncharacterized protein n=1 Tax=Acorus calamus TaxID=4465 RepID=A0AAV9D4N0_ACOCL|nr:hypothetical protein QJS10_CPB15g01648 [Acorus calamus]